MGRAVAAGLMIAAVAASSAAAAPLDPDGRYRGTHVTETGLKLTQKVSFRVSKGGRRITRLRTTATTLCVGPTLFDNRVFIAPVYVARMRIGRGGRFHRVLKPAKETKLELSGRRRGRQVEGHIDVKIANCSAMDDFVARRVGP